MIDVNMGFITIHKKITSWEWYTDVPTKVLFIHCLLNANYIDKKWKGIEIKRGCFISSFDKLASETGLSRQQVRRAIKNLESTHEITRSPTSKYTLFKVNNYNEYQSVNTRNNTQTTFKQHSNNIQTTLTKEKERKIKNKKEYIYRSKINQTWDEPVEEEMSEEERQMLIDEIERMKEKDD